MCCRNFRIRCCFLLQQKMGPKLLGEISYYIYIVTVQFQDPGMTGIFTEFVFSCVFY